MASEQGRLAGLKAIYEARFRYYEHAAYREALLAVAAGRFGREAAKFARTALSQTKSSMHRRMAEQR